MVRLCYLCQRKTSQNLQISMHRFPKNSKLRTKWIQACGLNASDDVSSIYICSQHFRPQDYCVKFGASLFRKASLLVRGAVPSISVPNKAICMVESDIRESPTIIKPPATNNLFGRLSIKCSDREYDDIDILDRTAEIQSKPIEMTLEMQTMKRCESSAVNAIVPDQDMVKGMPRGFRHDSNTSAVETELPLENVAIENSDNSRSLKKRRYAEPRYVSEIVLSDFETPDQARRVISMMKTNDRKRLRTIKTLRDKNRQLLKRVSILEKLVARMKQATHTSEIDGETSRYSIRLTKRVQHS